MLVMTSSGSWIKSLKTMLTRENHVSMTFDYHLLRLAMGVIAMSLPIAVTFMSGVDDLESISVSYFSSARDWFVGLLFVVATFLFAYKGHYVYESLISAVGSVAAIGVAVFPTLCEPKTAEMCKDVVPIIDPNYHNAFAGLLLLVLTYFCLGPFRQQAAKKPGKAVYRKWIYIICGTIMLFCLAAIFAKFKQWIPYARTVYYAEAIALFAFGVSWIVAGKQIPFLVEKAERNLEH